MKKPSIKTVLAVITVSVCAFLVIIAAFFACSDDKNTIELGCSGSEVVKTEMMNRHEVLVSLQRDVNSEICQLQVWYTVKHNDWESVVLGRDKDAMRLPVGGRGHTVRVREESSGKVKIAVDNEKFPRHFIANVDGNDTLIIPISYQADMMQTYAIYHFAFMED